MSDLLFNLAVIPVIPAELQRLEELANDLWYGWNRRARSLFERIDPDLWTQIGHKPRLFLRCVAQDKLQQAATDAVYLSELQHVLTCYDAYNAPPAPQSPPPHSLKSEDLIAYFCAEYGLHESLPVYSGGLGILAGDHCKTASDLRLPFVAVGLFYHQGYFTQLIDREGNQIARHNAVDIDHVPIHPVLDENNERLFIAVEIAGRSVNVKAWRVKVGRIYLYLLDTDVAGNSPEDREITYQLYGGDLHTRIKQEIVLGIGGVRLLRRLQLTPSVWHLNEGHAAFLILERLREYVEQGYRYDTALEAVAASAVFTTHTPVPAGHDHFPQELVLHYLGHFAQQLGRTPESFLALGHGHDGSPDFNMTALAINGTRHVNGVSRIHGQVSSEICTAFWPEIPPQENPVDYVTNAVHVSTFLAQEWSNLFDELLGGNWRDQLCQQSLWQQLGNQVPEKVFWNTKLLIKSQMLKVIRAALLSQYCHQQLSQSHLQRKLKYIDPDNPNILTIGFARRFATYKRAALLFNDLSWLRELLSDEERPVVFIFMGKAHPADQPGQALLKSIHQLSDEPEFVGKILLLQGYDLAVARRLLYGVDVWLNNPVYPMEASGTSGMKAAINGTLNLSVLDGWWAEGYDGQNGWGIKPSPFSQEPSRRDQDDARSLYEILQDDVIPLYYQRNQYGYSPQWIRKAINSMTTILPRFNSVRFLNDYVEKFYQPASKKSRVFFANNLQAADELAQWKRQVREAWPGVQVKLLNPPKNNLHYGDLLELEVAVQLNGLSADMVYVELLLTQTVHHPEIMLSDSPTPAQTETYRFLPSTTLAADNAVIYRLSVKPSWCGNLTGRVRFFPHHALLSHRHEMGMMRWVGDF
jgi:glycogen phosphorylase